MSDVDAGDAADQINILFTILIIQKLLVALDWHKGFLVVMGVDRRDKGLVLADLLVGPARVGTSLVSAETCTQLDSACDET
jgi:hypothetical protein